MITAESEGENFLVNQSTLAEVVGN